MALNSKQHLVLIKGEDKTDNILRVSREGRRTAVTFENGSTYRYHPRNVEWLSIPQSTLIEDSRILVHGDILTDIREVLRFGNWVKVFRSTSGTKCCRSSEFSVSLMKTADGRSKDILAYLRQLSEVSSLKTDEGNSMLAMKYRNLSVVPNLSILNKFLTGQPPRSETTLSESGSELIFPFGCNMSQKAAVQKAFHSPISVIQGPPGTGKTQTILNLIANLLLEGKRVAVVSSNNSATRNVLEKLQKYELDFLAAFLGSNQNKSDFIKAQSSTAIQLPAAEESDEPSIRSEVLHLNRELNKAFETKNELAAIIQQIDAFRLELGHFEKFRQEVGYQTLAEKARSIQSSATAQRLMEHWVAIEQASRAASSSMGYLEKLFFLFRFGWKSRALLKMSAEERISILQVAYYQRKIQELENKQKRLEDSLKHFHFDERLAKLTNLSMHLLKHTLSKRYSNKPRKVFAIEDLWRKPDEFLGEYPVILSTTFSVITSVQNSYMFDCLIVDEASQVDLLTGALAMACTKKLVIVGDPMQLPNVLTDEDKERAKATSEYYDVPDYARFDRHNLLSSVQGAFPGLPQTLLREHYRCHPKIIEFCNQKFYGGELLIMTRDQGEPDVLKAYVTTDGNHARETFNQRQIDEVEQHVLPELGSIDPSEIGIVTPYRMQATKMQGTFGSKKIEVDTIHKYQGREKRVMIITTVANNANDFVDNPNLLNVAISRAQDKLRLVVSKAMAEGNGNVADFVRYIRYQNFEVVPGKVRSIFDLLYGDYTEARIQMLKKRKRVSNYDSENLAHREIETVLGDEAYQGYGVVTQFPLSMLIQDTDHLTPEEASYASHPWTKTDFLIFRKVDKSPVLVIEVDGYAFHRAGTRQAKRDLLKDSVLKKCGLPILRLSTVGSGEGARIRKQLEDAIR